MNEGMSEVRALKLASRWKDYEPGTLSEQFKVFNRITVAETVELSRALLALNARLAEEGGGERGVSEHGARLSE